MFIHDGPGGWTVGSPPPVRGAEQQQARLPFPLSESGARAHRGPNTALDIGTRLVEGTAAVLASWDHRVIHSSDPVAYAAGTNPQGKEVPAAMLLFVGNYISTLLSKFHKDDEEGQTLVEYGLLLALIAIIVIVALLFLGPIVSRIFQNVGSNLSGS
jgi:pilus assembly protein Flp/PilA